MTITVEEKLLLYEKSPEEALDMITTLFGDHDDALYELAKDVESASHDQTTKWYGQKDCERVKVLNLLVKNAFRLLTDEYEGRPKQMLITDFYRAIVQKTEVMTLGIDKTPKITMLLEIAALLLIYKVDKYK